MNRYFRQIEEFEDYYISPKGIIFSKKSNRNIKHNDKYVFLYKNGKKYMRSVSRIKEVTFNIDEININNLKPIIGFENYMIDKFGTIFSKSKLKERKTYNNSYGYKCIHLSNNGKIYSRMIHTLTYESWIGNIKKGFVVNHIDSNKNNNNINNLELISRSQKIKSIKC
jgi:hypothetical protein